MGCRTGTGADWTAREDKQQKDEELGGRRGQGQQEATIMKIMYTNVQSIHGKLNELSAYAAEA